MKVYFSVGALVVRIDVQSRCVNIVRFLIAPAFERVVAFLFFTFDQFCSLQNIKGP